jgi:hypothetical protein
MFSLNSQLYTHIMLEILLVLVLLAHIPIQLLFLKILVYPILGVLVLECMGYNNKWGKQEAHLV